MHSCPTSVSVGQRPSGARCTHQTLRSWTRQITVSGITPVLIEIRCSSENRRRTPWNRRRKGRCRKFASTDKRLKLVQQRGRRPARGVEVGRILIKFLRHNAHLRL